MKRRSIGTLLLALVMALSCVAGLVGCKDQDKPPVGTEKPIESQEGPKYTYDENGYIRDNLPELNYGYDNVNMLHWNSGKEEYTTKEGSDVISNALYNRVLNLESRLKCYLTIEYANGDWNSRSDFINKVYNDVQTGAPTYDIVSQYSFVAPVLTMYGCYRNLNEIGNLDLDMPWWNQDIRASVQLGDKLYFETGDIAPTTIYMTYVIFFNSNRIVNYGYTAEELYQLVLDRKWTLEELERLVLLAYEDKNGNSVADDGDFFGIQVSDNVHYDSLFYGAGMKIFINDQNSGKYILSPDFVGMKTTTLLSDCTRIFHNEASHVEGSSFRDDSALFMLGNIGHVTGSLAKVDFNYGILPIPMYDENQKEYASTLAVPYSMYAVPYLCKDYDRSGAVMEALASDAYRRVTPAIFEEGLKVRYSKEERNAQVYDILRDTLVFDIGRLWGEQVNAFPLFRNALAQKRDWASQVDSNKGKYVQALNDIIEAIGKLDH